MLSKIFLGIKLLNIMLIIISNPDKNRDKSLNFQIKAKITTFVKKSIDTKFSLQIIR